MRSIKIFFNIVILGAIFIFFADNYDVLQYKVQLKMGFFFTTPYLFPPISLYMLLLLVFALAAVIMLLLLGKEVISLRFIKRKLTRIIKEQETELVALRTLPLKEHTIPKQVEEDVPSDNIGE